MNYLEQREIVDGLKLSERLDEDLRRQNEMLLARGVWTRDQFAESEKNQRISAAALSKIVAQ